MDPQLPQVDPKGEALKRELERKSLDKIMIYNPLDDLFSFEYDGYLHTVKSKEKKTFERFLAEKFRRDIKNHIIHKMDTDAVMSRQKALEKVGVTSSAAKYQANDELQSKYRTDNPELVEKIYKEVWLGLVEKYGASSVRTPAQEVRQLTGEEQLSQELENVVYTESEKVEDTKKEAVKEVSE